MSCIAQNIYIYIYDVFIEMHEQWTKNDTGIIVLLYRSILYRSILLWNQACHGIVLKASEQICMSRNFWMQNVCLKSRTRDVCGRFVVAVSFAEGNVCAAGAAAVGLLFFLPHRNGGFKLLWVCLCVRSYRVFWNLCLQIALEWLHDVARALFWGGSRSTKPCVFPCKVAAAGDERYLVCAAGAAAVGFLFSRERLRRVLRKKAAVILDLHTCTPADLDLHTFTPADLDFTPSHLQI